MKVHPQLLKTVHLLEDLRRGRLAKLVVLRFGLHGLESATVEGADSAKNLSEVRKIVDGGDAKKIG